MGRRVLTGSVFLLFAVAFIAAGCGRGEAPAPTQPTAGMQAEQSSVAPGKNQFDETAAKLAISGKAPKIIFVRMSPQMPRLGDQLSVEARTDGDGAGGVVLRYAWSVNGTGVDDAKGPVLAAPLKKGDKVSVVITPTKGNLVGPSVAQFVTIGNSPPFVKSNLANVQTTLDKFTASVVSEDPDGDVVFYSLLQGPEGMDINKINGQLTWSFLKKTSGVYSVSISVKDSDSAETILNLPISIEFGKVPEKK